MICTNCNDTKKALYFSELSMSHEERECHFCRANIEAARKTDFLITTEPGEHHNLQITWGYDRSLIYLSTNARTMACSPAMAEEIMRGLMAILKGGFDRAVSETSLRMEQEDAAFRANRPLRSSSAPTSPPPKPTLDLL